MFYNYLFFQLPKLLRPIIYVNLLLLLFGLFLSKAYSQNTCLAGGITFSTQNEIDTFSEYYPDCTNILGGVLIVNSNIYNLNGLSQIQEIGGYLEIWGNENLTNLNGLNQLNSLGGTFWLTENPALTSLEALAQLNTVNGQIYIGFNDSLSTLSGLDNINPNSFTELTIRDNPNLSFCEVQSICNYLSIPSNSATITGNTGDCSNRAFIEHNCSILNTEWNILTSSISLQPNPTNDKVYISGIEQHPVEISVFTLTGIPVLTTIINEIDLSSLPSGLYLVNVIIQNQCWQTKLIKN